MNNLVFFNKKLVGYTLLRKRKFGTKINKKNYFHFDTLIVDKNYRKIGIKILKELNVKGNYNRIKHLYSAYSLKRDK